ncbi:MAG: helix-turn-helix domain-containing protein [Oscillospiraceae bacterium]|nr:helix-turn-helix domain-containing protein [Oscillospiraceae bacterium]
MDGARLKEARGKRTQREVANELGISFSALCMYENGDRTPRDELKVRMAKLYGQTVGHLFFGE